MKKNINKLLCSGVALLAMMGVLPSYASVPLHLDGLNSNYIQQQPIKFNGSSQTSWVGGFAGKLNNGPQSFFFCVDLRHLINLPGDYQVDPTNPNQATAAYLQLGSPFNMEVAASMVNNANVASFGNDTDKYTALQLAVWSVVYNWTLGNHPTNTLGTATDLFSAPNVVDPSILNAALGFLSLADGFVVNNTYGSSYGNYKLLLNASNSPDHITQTVIGVQAPEPGTYLMLGSFLVLGALSLKRGRRLQQV